MGLLSLRETTFKQKTDMATAETCSTLPSRNLFISWQFPEQDIFQSTLTQSNQAKSQCFQGNSKLIAWWKWKELRSNIAWPLAGISVISLVVETKYPVRKSLREERFILTYISGNTVYKSRDLYGGNPNLACGSSRLLSQILVEEEKESARTGSFSPFSLLPSPFYYVLDPSPLSVTLTSSVNSFGNALIYPKTCLVNPGHLSI